MQDRNAGERLFLEQLQTIERAIRYACWRGSLADEDAEDFASYVKLKLIENDYAMIRSYEQRARFGAFISVVVQRLLLDYRIAQWGKFHASAAAKRMGDKAVTIEAMLVRDSRTLDEILPALLRRWPDLSRETVEQIARQLPSRATRTRTVELDAMGDTIDVWSAVSGDHHILAADRAEIAKRIETVIRTTLHEMDEHDRLLFRLRFESTMSVAEISRMLRIEQKPLYRRLQRLLQTLRARLEAVGVTAADADELTTNRTDLDFGFAVLDMDNDRSSAGKGSE
ncbi:MAG TPA: sigma-70 family RNA polymerase sigma factor [Thermoanaerobaculia bacterium]|nr:sigma-70 family RNA polymerase sigma factor [Thermoanaerobaculia bacterium]